MVEQRRDRKGYVRVDRRAEINIRYTTLVGFGTAVSREEGVETLVER